MVKAENAGDYTLELSILKQNPYLVMKAIRDLYESNTLLLSTAGNDSCRCHGIQQKRVSRQNRMHTAIQELNRSAGGTT